MSDNVLNLLHLFERPSDPLDRPRANDTVVYSLHGDEKALAVDTRFGKPPTSIVSIPERPDASAARLGTATSVPRGKPLSLFVETESKAAKDLCDVFMDTKDGVDLMQLAARVQSQVNEQLFVYALSYAILNKKNLGQLPSLVEVFPSSFMPQNKVMEALTRAMDVSPDKDNSLRIQHGPDFSSSNVKPEHRVSYWREDYGINSHHWHWHLAYPLNTPLHRDRKGELFYYMHQQMLARYDMERLSVGLNRVEALKDWRQPIPDGYFPKLYIGNTGTAWGTRQDNTVLKDFRRESYRSDFINVTDLELWSSRLYDAIHQGYLINRDGEHVTLSDDVSTGKRGIDILGDSIEADRRLSVNFPFYGNLHNIGHVIISVSHDPDSAHKEEMGVMASTATAMRDPVFYRWHRFIDGIFQEYKMSLQPYEQEELSLPNVVLDRVEVVTPKQEGNLTTGWSLRDFEAHRGLDFNSVVPVVLELTHLDHIPFEYHLQATNKLKEKQVTVRIFLAPKHNITGQEMTFLEQRLLWAEMDRFTVKLKKGKNHIKRSSKESSVTSPPEMTFSELEQPGSVDPGNPQNSGFCGCGWPQHLLLPRGKPEGMDYQMFFMLTDWEKDQVESPKDSKTCASAASFCGIQDAKYPDSRAMGFPFDRRPPLLRMDPSAPAESVEKTADLAKLDNIMLHDIKITFLNKNLKEKN